jgi:hypothetical protein
MEDNLDDMIKEGKINQDDYEYFIAQTTNKNKNKSMKVI